MSTIRVLKPDVVDKIAAGEVLERPANLVKELVENSLDAGATEIEVEFDRGGRDVLVRDNGRGIERDQLALALERHATSKIQDSGDLYRLRSFGFRGEALAAIAAVSRLQLTSRPPSAAQGFRVTSDFGKVGDPMPISAREGTEIRVQELFDNVPARLRFMKSEAAEHGQIKTALKAMALAHEGVGFRARSHQELIFHWPAGQSFQDRATQILQVKTLYPGRGEHGGVEVEAMVSSPQDTLKVNRGMWFFVQGRWVQDRSMAAAVMEAYRNLLMHGEYPSVVVRVKLAPEEVDVNVHPTKAQVKFRDNQAVFRAVTRTVREVLERAPWLPAALSASRAPEFTFPVEEAAPETLSFTAPEFERTQYSTKAFPLAEVRQAVVAYSAPVPTPVKFAWADLQVIGQLNHTYIVAQGGDTMYLVDQHAAHERVVFERLMHSFRAGKIEVQNLLLPMVFDLSAEETEALVTHKDEVEKFGLNIERMGPESVAVQAIPMIVSEGAVNQALQRLAYEILDHGDSMVWEKVVGETFASMACHSVIRAGQSQSPEQMKALLAQMDEFPLSSFCPHGRPVYIRRAFTDIEREFGRIV
ncbi:MAG TPA: DNA mismatch repair endonuclease MutL [Bdellovibrionales bacterium]|nr:DNA mismatch repair endonuclease MutL [Bdellovibrionales bacterium]